MDQYLKSRIVETVRTNTVQLLSRGYRVCKPPLKITIIKTDDTNCNDDDYDDIDDPSFVTYELTLNRGPMITEKYDASAYTCCFGHFQSPEWDDLDNIYCAMENKFATQRQVTKKPKQNMVKTILDKFRQKIR